LSYSLIIVDSDGAAREIAVGPGRLTIGRGPLNDLVIVGRGVSRQHAILTVTDKVVVEDLDSTYGTKVNDRQVRQSPLAVGDHVDIGTFRLVLLPGDEKILRAVVDPPTPPPPSGQYEAERRSGVPQSPFDEPTTAVLTTSELEFTVPPRGGADVPELREAFQRALAGEGYEGQVRFVWGSSDMPGKIARVMDGPAAGEPELLADRVERLLPALSSPGPGHTARSDLSAMLATYRAALLFGRTSDLGGFLERLLDLLVAQLGLSSAVLVRRDELSQFQPVAVRHADPLRRGEIPVSRAVLEQAMETQQPILSHDLRNDPAFGDRESVTAYKMGALLATPLLVAGTPVGVLHLIRQAGSPFDRAETDRVMILGPILGRALVLHVMEGRATADQQRVQVLSQFHAPEVVEQVCSARTTGPGLERKTATAVHVELPGLDQRFADLGVEKGTELMVSLRSIIHAATTENGGTLVWLHESSSLALFGGQSASENDAMWALNMATAVLRETRALCRSTGLSLPVRIGLDRGPVHVGVVGPTDRLLYTAVGAPVVRARAAAAQGAEDRIRLTRAVLTHLPGPRTSAVEVTDASGDPEKTVYEVG
jgi:class 3 adenylate cyclase